MSHLRAHALPFLVPALALVIAACSAGATASAPPSAGGSGSPTAPGEQPSSEPSPSVDAGGELIEYPTGATDVVLRYEEGGGFVMPGFLAAQTPHFVLYGDRTVVFRDPFAEGPPAQGSAFLNGPLETAQLSEAQVQELLRFALGEGGLAVARPEYRNDMIADASTAVFTVDAAGIQKSVSVYALGLDGMEGIPDAPARAAFAALAKRLVSIDDGGSVASDVYVPEAYRVTLLESPGAVAPDLRPWPWADRSVADFQPDPGPDGLQFPHLTMTSEEVAALGVTDFEGGFNGLLVTGDDGKRYTVAVRPLLPGEEG
jgi:hypothetical protein